MKSASAFNLLLGSWLFVSPVILGATGVEAVNCGISGLLVIVAAIASIVFPRAGCAPQRINFSVGLWSFVSPWFLAVYTGEGFALLNGMFVGAFVLVLALARAVPAEPATM